MAIFFEAIIFWASMPAKIQLETMMIDLKEVVECENNFPSNFTNVYEKPYGKLFYNRDNPRSYDSNHAIILDFNYDLDIVFEEITSFYQSIKVTPRIYQAFQAHEQAILAPYFKKHGFTYQEYENDFLVFENKAEFDRSPEMEIRRVNRISSGIVEIILSEDEGDWTVKVLERHLASDNFHLLAGFLDHKPVTLASIKVMDKLSRVDDVITHKEYRGRGYGRSIINHLVNYHASISNNTLYLYAANPIAIKIYREVGFVDFPQKLTMWHAWKENS
jgi:GNAT superfamily N-acetyltransferase